MEWLKHDLVPRGDLDEWAQGASEPFRARLGTAYLFAEGMTVESRGRYSAIRWEDVLVPVRLERPARLLIATARRPPLPPWFELGGDRVDELQRAVEERVAMSAQRGYREVRRPRAPMAPDEVLAAVLSNQPLPGAVDIPAATPSVLRSSILGSSVGALVCGGYGLMLGVPGAAIGAALGALGGAGLLGTVELFRRSTVGRVLVLTPDGFVGGLDGRRVRAVPWASVRHFAVGIDDRDDPALEVVGVEGGRLARVAAKWFGKDLDVIVAVAEAYRTRATK